MSLQIRLGGPPDWKAVRALLSAREGAMLRGESEVEAQLQEGDTVVAYDGAQLIALLGISPQNPAVGQVTSLAVTVPILPERAVDLLLPHLVAAVRARHLRLLVYTAIEPWLVPALIAHGFRLSTRVISYQLDSMTAPPLPRARARLAPPSADLRSVVEVDREAFPLEWHYGERIIREAYEGAAHFRVAEVDEETVGYAYGSLHGQSAHLTRLAVRPAYQDHGIGTTLLADAIEHFARLGAWWMTLNTQEENAPAQRIYDAFGFRLVGAPVPFMCLSLSGDAGSAGLSHREGA